MTLRVNLKEISEQKFREFAMKKFGYKRGAIAEALQEAITEWLERHEGNLPRYEDPFRELEGILEGVSESSVELQHLGTKLILRSRDSDY